MKATATLEDTNLYYFRSFAIIPTHSTCKAWRNYPDTFETLFLFFFSDECVTNWLSSYFCFKLNLKGYCHDNFTAFSSKLWWNYDPEPLFKTRTLLQPQEEDIKRFSKEEQTRVFFWRYFPLTMAKLENVILTFSSCSPYMCHPWPTTTISSLSSLINHFYTKRDHSGLLIIADQNISFGFSRFKKISWQCPFNWRRTTDDCTERIPWHIVMLRIKIM